MGVNGAKVFIAVAPSNFFLRMRPRHEIPYILIGIGLHWLWLYKQNFLLSWQPTQAQHDLP
ncbi:hypothetical protein AUC60_06890 [Pseudomonas caspiana]|uniref:Uncharacterized protein n=1 Tax=Pseudomonas caspiana TaxID=1451454 RepID=A0A1Y3P3V0_9PSED|nr:hypothetical protein AUC60_06890 [Pseudomonas caspiana]